MSSLSIDLSKLVVKQNLSQYSERGRFTKDMLEDGTLKPLIRTKVIVLYGYINDISNIEFIQIKRGETVDTATRIEITLHKTDVPEELLYLPAKYFIYQGTLRISGVINDSDYNHLLQMLLNSNSKDSVEITFYKYDSSKDNNNDIWCFRYGEELYLSPTTNSENEKGYIVNQEFSENWVNVTFTNIINKDKQIQKEGLSIEKTPTLKDKEQERIQENNDLKKVKNILSIISFLLFLILVFK